MRAVSKFLALAFAAALQPAMAGTVFLNFEDVTATEQLTTRYAGAPWGVTASGGAYTAVSETCAPNYPLRVSFSRSCGALWLIDPQTTAASTSLTLSVAGGFSAMSFLYSGSIGAPDLEVHVYDASGLELGLGLTNLQGSVSTGYTFANWSSLLSPSFSGNASTVVFTAKNGTILLDDLSFTVADLPGTTVPEPTSVALALGALGALGWTRRRAAR